MGWSARTAHAAHPICRKRSPQSRAAGPLLGTFDLTLSSPMDLAQSALTYGASDLPQGLFILCRAGPAQAAHQICHKRSPQSRAAGPLLGTFDLTLSSPMDLAQSARTYVASDLPQGRAMIPSGQPSCMELMI
ncbi:MAG: hypothetical protein AAGF79_18385 [Pseudomonadota bacterium]